MGPKGACGRYCILGDRGTQETRTERTGRAGRARPTATPGSLLFSPALLASVPRALRLRSTLVSPGKLPNAAVDTQSRSYRARAQTHPPLTPLGPAAKPRPRHLATPLGVCAGARAVPYVPSLVGGACSGALGPSLSLPTHTTGWSAGREKRGRGFECGQGVWRSNVGGQEVQVALTSSSGWIGLMRGMEWGCHCPGSHPELDGPKASDSSSFALQSLFQPRLVLERETLEEDPDGRVVTS